MHQKDALPTKLNPYGQKYQIDFEDSPDLNLHKGQVGTVIEVYEKGVFEVEFFELKGKTYAVETLNALH